MTTTVTVHVTPGAKTPAEIGAAIRKEVTRVRHQPHRAPGPQPAVPWQSHLLFQEPRYEGGAPWADSDDLDDEDA